jgi:hypothetical protein
VMNLSKSGGRVTVSCVFSQSVCALASGAHHQLTRLSQIQRGAAAPLSSGRVFPASRSHIGERALAGYRRIADDHSRKR